jgi:hypothetical protein
MQHLRQHNQLAVGAATAIPQVQSRVLHRKLGLVRRKKFRQPRSGSFYRDEEGQHDNRRFNFDSIDTLPYWYTPARRAFADVSPKAFLDTAERWIVDRWGVHNNPSRWKDEPRKHRDNRHSLMPLDHRHGELPLLETFHTYLEWHAMWCTMGELMQTHALTKIGVDDYDSFESRLQRWGITMPPLWLADLHGMKPLEDRFCFPPQDDIDVWVDNVRDADFLTELGVNRENGMLVVDSYYETQSRDFKLSASVATALVSPDTASALVRALQTVDDSWNYRIPPTEHELEIHTPPYKLVGWLVDVHHDVGIDEHDPLRYEVRAIECRPADQVATVLNLEFAHDDQARWVDIRSRNTVFTYEAWGDTRGDESDDQFRYNGRIQSSGHRLQIDKEALRMFLNKMNLDLIVEVEITRRDQGYGYPGYDEEKAHESRFDRVLLFRRDGTIEGAEGRLGTWTSPRA